MLEKGLLHLPVVDKDHVVGMLTSRELLRNFAELY
jgi:CBS domain-containing protein